MAGFCFTGTFSGPGAQGAVVVAERTVPENRQHVLSDFIFATTKTVAFAIQVKKVGETVFKIALGVIAKKNETLLIPLKDGIQLDVGDKWQVTVGGAPVETNKTIQAIVTVCVKISAVDVVPDPIGDPGDNGFDDDLNFDVIA